MKNVYPGIRSYCQKFGLEFEVVDMRWGVNDDMSADHLTTQLCLKEINNCRRLSQGPQFVVSFYQLLFSKQRQVSVWEL